LNKFHPKRSPISTSSSSSSGSGSAYLEVVAPPAYYYGADAAYDIAFSRAASL